MSQIQIKTVQETGHWSKMKQVPDWNRQATMKRLRDLTMALLELPHYLVPCHGCSYMCYPSKSVHFLGFEKTVELKAWTFRLENGTMFESHPIMNTISSSNLLKYQGMIFHPWGIVSWHWARCLKIPMAGDLNAYLASGSRSKSGETVFRQFLLSQSLMLLSWTKCLFTKPSSVQNPTWLTWICSICIGSTQTILYFFYLQEKRVDKHLWALLIDWGWLQKCMLGLGVWWQHPRLQQARIAGWTQLVWVSSFRMKSQQLSTASDLEICSLACWQEHQQSLSCSQTHFPAITINFHTETDFKQCIS